MGRLQSLLEMCDEEGVHTRPKAIGQCGDGTGGVLVVPLLSWHHSSFDTEPDITNWEGIPDIEVSNHSITSPSFSHQHALVHAAYLGCPLPAASLLTLTLTLF